jgi:Iron-containing redox enzyme
MTDLTHSEILTRKIWLAERRLDEAARAFWTHPKLPTLFPEFLFVLYSSMRSTVPLMEAAMRCARSKVGFDPVAAITADYFAEHIEEEQHHDEWLLEDMLASGIEHSAVLNRIPPASIASLVGSQYYWIQHAHPVALFGFLVVLEGNPASVQQLRAIQTRHGLPAAAFRTLIEHAETDLDHFQGLKRTLDQLPLQEQHSVLIALSAFQTIDKLSCVFEELLERHDDSDTMAIAPASGTTQPSTAAPTDVTGCETRVQQ